MLQEKSLAKRGNIRRRESEHWLRCFRLQEELRSGADFSRVLRLSHFGRSVHQSVSQSVTNCFRQSQILLNGI